MMFTRFGKRKTNQPCIFKVTTLGWAALEVAVNPAYTRLTQYAKGLRMLRKRSPKFQFLFQQTQ